MWFTGNVGPATQEVRQAFAALARGDTLTPDSSRFRPGRVLGGTITKTFPVH
jgi:hypothetical protein